MDDARRRTPAHNLSDLSELKYLYFVLHIKWLLVINNILGYVLKNSADERKKCVEQYFMNAQYTGIQCNVCPWDVTVEKNIYRRHWLF